MKSRYDCMKESSVKDIDGEFFPDPLSLSYDISVTELPSKKQVNSVDIAKFWLFMQNNYDMAEEDDILLGVNGVPYVGMLEPGDEIYLVSKTDLENFAANNSADS